MKQILILLLLSQAFPALCQVDKATVYFYRESGIGGSAVTYRVFHDTVTIGRVKSGDIFVYQSPLGIQTFSANTESTGAITIKIEAGRTYYIKCGLSVGVLVGKPTLRQVGSAEARVAFGKANKYAAELVKPDSAEMNALSQRPTQSNKLTATDKADTAKALNNLYARKRSGGTVRGVIFGILGISNLIVGSKESNPTNLVFGAMCVTFAITGFANTSKFGATNQEVVVRDYLEGKGIPPKIKSRLKKKDFK